MAHNKVKGDTIVLEGEVYNFYGSGLGGSFETASVINNEDTSGGDLGDVLLEYEGRKVKVTVEFLD